MPRKPTTEERILSTAKKLDKDKRRELLLFCELLTNDAIRSEADHIYQLIAKTKITQALEYIRGNPPSAEVVVLLATISVGEEGLKEKNRRTNTSAKAADTLHSKLGGTRDKREAIKQAWASGRFSSRTQCAEQESGAIGMSLSTAIKALQNTPDPSPWPAKAK